MASMTSAAVTIPKFTGLKSSTRGAAPALVKVACPAKKSFSVKASLREAAVGVAAGAVVLAATAGGAMAASVGLGSSDGGLVFEPSSFSIASGETITFKNVAGFPHNVVFDEDEIPSGVDASKISMPEDELLNAAGETYAVTLTEKGTYSFYCSPHQGAGMVGKVTVN